MALVKKLIDVVSVRNDNGEIQKPKNNLKAFLILSYIYDEEFDEEIRTFDVVRGNNEAVRLIFDNRIENVDIFKSQVISETITPRQSISIYSFIRLQIQFNKLDENTKKYLEDSYGITDVESLNAFIDDNSIGPEEGYDKFFEDDTTKEASIGDDD